MKRCVAAFLAISCASFACANGEIHCASGKSKPTQPAYPAAAKMEGRGGTTVLRLVIDQCGDVTDAAVSQSSGSKDLDEAAVAAALTWRVDPTLGGVAMISVVFSASSTDAASSETAAPGNSAGPAEVNQADDLPVMRQLGESQVPGYIADDRPIGYARVSDVLEYLRAPCAGFTNPGIYCQVEVVREDDPRVVQVTSSCDVSFWAVFDVGSELGPSVVRDRFFFPQEGGSYIRSSYLCEANSDGCRNLLMELKSRPPQPQPGPPPPPPPSPGVSCD